MEYASCYSWCTVLYPCLLASQWRGQIVSWLQNQGPRPNDLGPSAWVIRRKAHEPRPCQALKLPNSLLTVNNLWISPAFHRAPGARTKLLSSSNSQTPGSLPFSVERGSCSRAHVFQAAGVKLPNSQKSAISTSILELAFTHRARRAFLFSYQCGRCPSSVKLEKVIHN